MIKFISRDEAKSKIFHYIKMFYNPKRQHSYLVYLSPNEFEIRYFLESKNHDMLTHDNTSTK